MLDGTATLRGVTIGQGTVYRLTNWPLGLMDTPAMRVNDIDRPNRDGVIPGADYYSTRDVVFNILVNAGSQALTEAALADLGAAFARSDSTTTLDVRVLGSPAEYRLVGKPRGMEVAFTREDFVAGIARAQCRFVATDPVRYALTEDSLSLELSAAGSGLLYPVTYPVVYGGGGAGQGNAVNAGTADVDWTATFTGPLVNPRLEHVGSGKFVRVAQSITASQSVVLDSARGAVLLGGTAPRPSWLATGSAWFRLGAGSNVLRFTADSGTGGCAVTWRSGWA